VNWKSCVGYTLNCYNRDEGLFRIRGSHTDALNMWLYLGNGETKSLCFFEQLTDIRALILLKILALYKSFTYLLTYLLIYDQRTARFPTTLNDLQGHFNYCGIVCSTWESLSQTGGTFTDYRCYPTQTTRENVHVIEGVARSLCDSRVLLTVIFTNSNRNFYYYSRPME